MGAGANKNKVDQESGPDPAAGNKFNFNDPNSMRVAAWVLDSSAYVQTHKMEAPDEFQGSISNREEMRRGPKGKQISCFDSFMNNFRELEYIQTKKNLESFPLKILRLRHLTVLDLHSNFVRVIPSSIRDLQNLVNLQLHDNMITDLPLELGALTKLQVLTLHSNQVTALPPNIGNLGDLLILQIQDTLLTCLPQTISLLNCLQDFRGAPRRPRRVPPQATTASRLPRPPLSQNLASPSSARPTRENLAPQIGL
jgi:Leucine-rich repeat (LRR) protein